MSFSQAMLLRLSLMALAIAERHIIGDKAGDQDPMVLLIARRMDSLDRRLAVRPSDAPACVEGGRIAGAYRENGERGGRALSPSALFRRGLYFDGRFASARSRPVNML